MKTELQQRAENELNGFLAKWDAERKTQLASYGPEHVRCMEGIGKIYSNGGIDAACMAYHSARLRARNQPKIDDPGP